MEDGITTVQLPKSTILHEILVADWEITVVSSSQQVLVATVRILWNFFDDKTLSATANDTSVIIITACADVNLTDDTTVKHSTSWEASFWGLNAAVNVQNTLVSYITDINVATHNGAANIYAYGSDIVVHVDGAWLYSSGPAAHGLYASGDSSVRRQPLLFTCLVFYALGETK
ncbi:hypothetical protein N7494_003127 [Penicillium frequentans]|uniref:Uncharacterized protein n=1 Tax=Penicillium frequentans TaxID=3151616 RepID=A0AAD6GJE5_9EURO|nr:hypothetical protein N7494_003127 [Penicillium glabrum]